jgi:ribosome-associated protein
MLPFHLHDDEITYRFMTSQGPGGQNVNKVATAVQLRFNVLHSKSFSNEARERLLIVLHNKMTTQGDIIIKANRYRTQERNKEDAKNRLIEMLKRALTIPKKRRQTKPTQASVQKRLKQKKLHGAKKIARRSRDEF